MVNNNPEITAFLLANRIEVPLQKVACKTLCHCWSEIWMPGVVGLVKGCPWGSDSQTHTVVARLH